MARKKSKSTKRRAPHVLGRINHDAAGIDCGAAEHVVAVPEDRCTQSVRSFKTFTASLNELVEWLVACRIQTVAMEATGVYWIAVFEMLEARGIEVVLVNARHFRNVPGRKSDVSDAEWLQELHTFGLLRGSFRPKAEVVTLRSYLRHRETLVQSAATSVQRMQKALVQMNLQLHIVIADVAGVTGLRILRAIVGGVTDPAQLAQHRDLRCHASEQDIQAALTGHYRPEHIFALRQNLEQHDLYHAQIAACDGAVQAHLEQMATASPPRAQDPLPPPRTRTRPQKNQPRFDSRPLLYHLTGADLSLIDGIQPYTALRILSEIGTDMTRWPTDRHFTSWLTLAPKNKISGGRLLSSRTQRSANRAALAFRLAAQSLGRTQTALGAFFRRLAFRVGTPKAITATARKLAVIVYRTLKGEIIYRDDGATAYDSKRKAQALRRLRLQAQTLGLALVSRSTGEILEGGVS